MDGAQVNTYTSEASTIAQKLSEMSTDSNPLTLVVSITDMRDSASTDTVIHVPEDAGTTAFNNSMLSQFMEFIKSSNPPKRKREDRPIEVTTDGQSKHTKPNIPEIHQSGYKDGRNSRTKMEKFSMAKTALRRYSSFDDHLVPKPMEVNILVILIILLIKLLQHRQLQ